MSRVSDPPAFTKHVFEIDILQGDSRVENLAARANPSRVRYSWERESRRTADSPPWQPDSQPWQPDSSPLLTLSRVSRTQAGWYRLTASNSEGNTTVRVLVNVQCECGETEALSAEELSWWHCDIQDIRLYPWRYPFMRTFKKSPAFSSMTPTLSGTSSLCVLAFAARM